MENFLHIFSDKENKLQKTGRGRTGWSIGPYLFILHVNIAQDSVGGLYILIIVTVSHLHIHYRQTRKTEGQNSLY